MTILVAGCGNIFLGDDGFGSVVARRLAGMVLPEGVTVTDFGIGGIHLAYELTGGYAATILIDAVPRGGRPGTLYVLRPAPDDVTDGSVDAHDMTPEAVLALAATLDGTTGRVLLVGCEPADTSPGMDLSPPVADAVAPAADLVLDLIREEPVSDVRPSTGRRGDQW
ncbi:hydrogenase maturation protease [Actinoallomurus liliacearum]|uniref:Hydrogenase maturation protease n=1 Tax=Actinoallomurus liliacearum TaxID=1080073 RepID=A0ABP8TCZ7_9ACTN